MGKVIHYFPDAAAGRMAAKLLNRHSPREIAEAIEILMDVLDLMDGDPDAEDNGDLEPDADGQGDQSWIEWHQRGKAKLDRGLSEPLGRDRYRRLLTEDDEDDDPAEEDDPSGQCDEDGINTSFPFGHGAGCSLADPGGCDLMR